MKQQKKDEAITYFTEYLQSKGIDFLTFDDMDINVTLNARKKGLKDKIKANIDKVSDDLAMIDTQEYAAEILVEYKKSLNVSQAILTVNNRRKAIEEERKRAEEARAAREQQSAVVQRIDEVVEEQQVLTAPEETSVPMEVPVVNEVAVSEFRRVIEIPIRVDYPEEKHAELIQLCREFKEKLIERGFRIVKR